MTVVKSNTSTTCELSVRYIRSQDTTGSEHVNYQLVTFNRKTQLAHNM